MDALKWPVSQEQVMATEDPLVVKGAARQAVLEGKTRITLELLKQSTFGTQRHVLNAIPNLVTS
jgi:hypothetical protein